MDRWRGRFALFGLGCAFGGWVLASVAQWMALDVWTCVLVLLGILLVVTWAADRLTAAPPPPPSSSGPAGEAGCVTEGSVRGSAHHDHGVGGPPGAGALSQGGPVPWTVVQAPDSASGR